jgi:hypothetical protein
MGENTENNVSRLCQKVEKSVLKEYERILRKNGDIPSLEKIFLNYFQKDVEVGRQGHFLI